MQPRQLPALPPCLFLLAVCSLSSPRAALAGCWKSKKTLHSPLLDKITSRVTGTTHIFHVGSGALIPWMLSRLSGGQGRQLPTQPHESQFRVRGQRFLFLQHQPYVRSGSRGLARLTAGMELGFKPCSWASMMPIWSIRNMERLADPRDGDVSSRPQGWGCFSSGVGSPPWHPSRRPPTMTVMPSFSRGVLS